MTTSRSARALDSGLVCATLLAGECPHGPATPISPNGARYIDVSGADVMVYNRQV
ncbi:MAG TPA: hypothetical protein VFG23_21910 [Polyangia bacterium]|nr:hypothetical protein [Polyangia bacterium]